MQIQIGILKVISILMQIIQVLQGIDFLIYLINFNFIEKTQIKMIIILITFIMVFLGKQEKKTINEKEVK